MCIISGIVFDDLDGSDGSLEYTLRLRHEVGEEQTWNTDRTGPQFERLGPRIDNKSVNNCNIPAHKWKKLLL